MKHFPTKIRKFQTRQFFQRNLTKLFVQLIGRILKKKLQNILKGTKVEKIKNFSEIKKIGWNSDNFSFVKIEPGQISEEFLLNTMIRTQFENLGNFCW